MAATKTAEGLIRGLCDDINQRLGAGVATLNYHTDGNVYALVQVSTGNDSKKAIVLLKPTGLASEAVDALGIAQRQFNPHVAQCLFDIDGSNGATPQHILYVLGNVLRWGVLVEQYNVDANAIAISDIAAGNLVGTWQPLPGRDVGAV